MTPDGGLELQVGGRVWLDGQWLEVTEFVAGAVRLRSNTGAVRVVALTEVMEAARPPVETEPEVAAQNTLHDVPGVVMAGLSSGQQAKLAARVDVLRRIQDPEPGDNRPILRRYDDAAAALGVSRRTLQRQMARFLELGPAGLVDARLLQDVRRTVDPRWDSACLMALATFTRASNPTKQAVIQRANQEFLRAVPDGKPPSTAVAYRRLDELDKGRYTFGSAKQRRSVAKRPTGVLRRLRADRPGQYVLLDSYRLDVFAMEPVTLRWVNCELTVAMDLFDRCITGLRLRPVAAQSPDVASVLYQTVTPQTWGWAAGSPQGPYAGLPDGIVLGDPGSVVGRVKWSV